jgi:hypothetical protein
MYSRTDRHQRHPNGSHARLEKWGKINLKKINDLLLGHINNYCPINLVISIVTLVHVTQIEKSTRNGTCPDPGQPRPGPDSSLNIPEAAEIGQTDTKYNVRTKCKK